MHYVLNTGYPLEARRRTQNCQVHKFSGPDYLFSANLASSVTLKYLQSSKMKSINDPKGLENKIYTRMKGRETFYGDHTFPITSCSEIQYVL